MVHSPTLDTPEPMSSRELSAYGPAAVAMDGFVVLVELRRNFNKLTEKGLNLRTKVKNDETAP